MENEQKLPETDPELQYLADQMEQGVRSGKYTWTEIQEALVSRTREAAVTTDEYVHENPWRVMGIAAGLGFILGVLLAPRSRK